MTKVQSLAKRICEGSAENPQGFSLGAHKLTLAAQGFQRNVRGSHPHHRMRAEQENKPERLDRVISLARLA
jgi:hypothetical protein